MFRAAPLTGLLVLFTVLDSTRLPSLRLSPESEELVDLLEGHHGVVAVVKRDRGLRIKVNNYYSLGSAAALEHEQNQALIPLMTHSNPRSVFFLGMGTGITAGGRAAIAGRACHGL